MDTIQGHIEGLREVVYKPKTKVAIIVEEMLDGLKAREFWALRPESDQIELPLAA